MMDTVICPNCKTGNPSQNLYCLNCGAQLGGQAAQSTGNVVVPLDLAPVHGASADVQALERHIGQLDGQVQQLNTQVSQLRNELFASRVGSSGLQSPNFLKRAFSVWGHYFVAQLIISAGLAIIYVCIVVVFIGLILGEY